MGTIVVIVIVIVVAVYLWKNNSDKKTSEAERYTVRYEATSSSLARFKDYVETKPELIGKEKVFGKWVGSNMEGYFVFNPDGTVVTDCVPGKIDSPTSGTYYVDEGNKFDMYFGNFGVEAKYEIESRSGADYMAIIMPSGARLECKKV